MWISFFTVVLAIAVGLGFGAVIVESGQKNTAPLRAPSGSHASAS